MLTNQVGTWPGFLLKLVVASVFSIINSMKCRIEPPSVLYSWTSTECPCPRGNNNKKKLHLVNNPFCAVTTFRYSKKCTSLYFIVLNPFPVQEINFFFHCLAILRIISILATISTTNTTICVNGSTWPNGACSLLISITTEQV